MRFFDLIAADVILLKTKHYKQFWSFKKMTFVAKNLNLITKTTAGIYKGEQ